MKTLELTIGSVPGRFRKCKLLSALRGHKNEVDSTDWARRRRESNQPKPTPPFRRKREGHLREASEEGENLGKV